jgi:hypothetical protein
MDSKQRKECLKDKKEVKNVGNSDFERGII